MNKMQKFVGFQKTYALGEGQISFFKQMLHLESLGILIIAVGTYFPNMRELMLWLLVPMIVAIMLTGYIGGRILDKHLNYVHAQTHWSNARNPEIQMILEGQSEIKQLLRFIKKKKQK